MSMTCSRDRGPESGFWLESKPLALASKSEGRRLALAQTGIPFTVDPADVDERAIEALIRGRGGGPDAIALELAKAKALAVAARERDRWVLGADQVASCADQMFGKPADLARAAEQLRFLSGRAHRLHSAVALARNDRIVFETVARADLDMRPLSETFLQAYLARAGDKVLTSAGAYQVEGLGAHLFLEIRGDHWTIMGLPLLPVLDALRREGALLA
jgi:septum formation protein